MPDYREAGKLLDQIGNITALDACLGSRSKKFTRSNQSQLARFSNDHHINRRNARIDVPQHLCTGLSIFQRDPNLYGDLHGGGNGHYHVGLYAWDVHEPNANIAISAGSAAVFAGALFLVRSQTTVEDTSWMSAMIRQTFIAGERIGGYQAMRVHFGMDKPKEKQSDASSNQSSQSLA